MCKPKTNVEAANGNRMVLRKPGDDFLVFMLYSRRGNANMRDIFGMQLLFSMLIPDGRERNRGQTMLVVWNVQPVSTLAPLLRDSLR